jgi:diacylglycerol kinase family enzyme
MKVNTCSSTLNKENGEMTMTTLPPARHFFVVNPVCFYSRREMDEVVAEIHCFFEARRDTAGASSEYAVHVSRFPRDAIGAIRRFAAAVPYGAPLRVYAVGGDGVLFDCLNGIVGMQHTELGVMPYGAQNSFYHIFGESDKKIFRSLKAQTSAPSVPMDALYCGSNYALSYCLIGLESLINADSRGMKKHHVFLRRYMPEFFYVMDAYFSYFGTLMNRAAFKQNYRMWVDGEDWSGPHAIINISNSPIYLGGKIIIPEAVPSDGLMDVLCSSDTNVLSVFRVMLHYMRGKHAEHPDLFSHRRAKKVFIISDSPLILDLDGEVFYDKYITVEMKPGAVRVIAPTFGTDGVDLIWGRDHGL